MKRDKIGFFEECVECRIFKIFQFLSKSKYLGLNHLFTILELLIKFLFFISKYGQVMEFLLAINSFKFHSATICQPCSQAQGQISII